MIDVAEIGAGNDHEPDLLTEQGFNETRESCGIFVAISHRGAVPVENNRREGAIEQSWRFLGYYFFRQHMPPPNYLLTDCAFGWLSSRSTACWPSCEPQEASVSLPWRMPWPAMSPCEGDVRPKTADI